MSEKDFKQLVDNEIEAFVDHMTGPYSSKKREVWIEARDECSEEFWRYASSKENND